MISSSVIIVAKFMELGIDHVFILFDTDETPVSEYIKYFNNSLKNTVYANKVTLVPIEPFLESWILSSYNNTDKKNDRKEIMRTLKSYGYSNKNEYNFINKKLDIKRIITNNSDFSFFVDKINEKL